MSGHSKWNTIKRAKEVTDAKRSKIFGKLSKEITVAVRQGGADPEANATLREVITRAKNANMPTANIDRILKGKADTKTQEATYEAFGPGGSALFIVTETDNPNRTVAEVRAAMKKYGGSVGGPGSVKWKFDDNMNPAYIAQLSQADTESTQQLIAELEKIDDVMKVFSDINGA